MWINHHSMFKRIQGMNSSLMFSNGLMLFLVTAVPFSTSLVADYYLSEAANTAVVVYCGLFVLINVSYNLLWHAASKNRQLLLKDVPEAFIEKMRRNLRIGFPAYLAAFIIAFFNIHIAISICVALWIFWGVLTKDIYKA